MPHWNEHDYIIFPSPSFHVETTRSQLHIRSTKYLATHCSNRPSSVQNILCCPVPTAKFRITSIDHKMKDENSDNIAGNLQNNFHYQPARVRKTCTLKGTIVLNGETEKVCP